MFEYPLNLPSSFGLTSLSTSSKRKTGLFTPTIFSPWMILPGMEPMYVRLEGEESNCNSTLIPFQTIPIPYLWPLMSDWSHMPPNEIL